MKLSRRRFLHLAAGAAALPVVPRIARAQTYPTRPVRWLVGYPPGGGADTVTRILAHWLSERLSQQVIIENRPGASTNISAQAVINSPSRRSHGPRTMAAARNSSTGSRPRSCIPSPTRHRRSRGPKMDDLPPACRQILLAP